MDSGAVQRKGIFPPCRILGTRQLRMLDYRMRALNVRNKLDLQITTAGMPSELVDNYISFLISLRIFLLQFSVPL